MTHGVVFSDKSEFFSYQSTILTLRGLKIALDLRIGGRDGTESIMREKGSSITNL